MATLGGYYQDLIAAAMEQWKKRNDELGLDLIRHALAFSGGEMLHLPSVQRACHLCLPTASHQELYYC